MMGVVKMKLKSRKNLLGVYDIILCFGAVIIGILMVKSSSGIFSQYPKEWLTKIPFQSWVTPGIIAIVVFGFGNLISAIVSFFIEGNKSWAMSAIMGGIFFVSLVAQIFILGEWYLATVQFFVLSIIQLALSGYVFSCNRKNKRIGYK